MNDVKQLPRGIPEGYTPQRQEVKSKAFVLVSEYTRQVAHELDDLHSKWIFRRQYDELADLDNSAYANRNRPIEHLEWLTDFSSASNRLAAATERRLWLQTELGNMRATRKVQGLGRSKKQFLDHYESLKRELLYVSVLQSRLRALAHAANLGEIKQSRLEKIGRISEKVAATDGAGDAILALIQLRSASLDWANVNNVEFSPSLRDALRAAADVIRAEYARLSDSLPMEDMTDSEIFDEFEKASRYSDSKRKGTPLNERPKQDWQSAP